MKHLLLIFTLRIFAATPTYELSPIAHAWDSFDRRRYDECLKYGQKAKSQMPTSANPNIVLGRCEERRGHFSDAHSYFQAATKSESKNADAWNNRVLMSIKDVRIQRAKDELALFVGLIPNDKRIPDLRKMIDQLEDHLNLGEMNEVETRRTLKEIYLNQLQIHKAKSHVSDK